MRAPSARSSQLRQRDRRARRPQHAGRGRAAARLRRSGSAVPPTSPSLCCCFSSCAVALYTGSQSEFFWTPFNLTNCLLLTLPLAFVALGQQFEMIARLIDISVGSTMSLTVVLMSMTLPDLAAASVLQDRCWLLPRSSCWSVASTPS